VPRADYYVLPQSDYDSRELFVCRLCDKLSKDRLRIHIHLASEADLAQLDQRLWSFKPESFLPHTILGQELKAPITLGTDENAAVEADLLINLTIQTPALAERFNRVAEVVIQDPEVLAASRESFKLRRDAGWEVYNHRMSS
jgi:DNA polymerase-3 subunit chi